MFKPPPQEFSHSRQMRRRRRLRFGERPPRRPGRESTRDSSRTTRSLRRTLIISTRRRRVLRRGGVRSRVRDDQEPGLVQRGLGVCDRDEDENPVQQIYVANSVVHRPRLPAEGAVESARGAQDPPGLPEFAPEQCRLDGASGGARGVDPAAHEISARADAPPEEAIGAGSASGRNAECADPDVEEAPAALAPRLGGGLAVRDLDAGWGGARCM